MRAHLAFLLLLAPSAALAQATTAVTEASAPVAGAGSPFTSLLPMVLIFVVFYFILIKPQQKRLKQHQATLAALKRGDKVLTGGGIVGKITKVNDSDMVTVEIATGVEVTVLKSTLSGLVDAIQATAPASNKKKSSGGDKNDNAVPSRDSIANDN